MAGAMLLPSPCAAWLEAIIFKSGNLYILGFGGAVVLDVTVWFCKVYIAACVFTFRLYIQRPLAVSGT